ncbi:hypothetical protein L873DRAFT_507272 [Choiromyces venosus 120613-1]|uniref:Uncharacterized protein n=1 Tax=Choiromyces venosus 120613-1 TaxID=1336337 RepID=A0A3N4IW76_9PEZI|nr:hypothetical protein L873DRAFT_507272 [Choiromyces venosus 120613-1]
MADSAVSPRSSITHSRRHSRKSTGNINFSQLSLSPLTSGTVVITEQDFRRKERKGREGSYIQGLSAPTTPGILSRNHSFSSRKNSYIDLPKSKSSSQLSHRSNSAEWLQRTGAALTSETREFKGQLWLVSRASSTSLVKDGDDDGDGIPDFFAAGTNNAAMAAGMTTPGGRRSSRVYSSGGYTSEELEALEEDNVYFDRLDEEGDLEEEEEEEEEIDIPRGFGLGQFVDRMIGWTMFAEDDTEDDESLDGYEEETLAKKAKFRSQSVKFDTIDEEKLREQRRLRDEDEGWQDPAWVFSIASRVLL